MASMSETLFQDLLAKLRDESWKRLVQSIGVGDDLRKSLVVNSPEPPPPQKENMQTVLAISKRRVFLWRSPVCYILFLDERGQYTGGKAYHASECDIEPISKIDRILLSPASCSLALVGPRSVSILDVGLDEEIQYAKRIGRLIPLSERFFLNNPKTNVLHVEWFPFRETHLVILTSDNTLRVFKINRPSQPELVIALSGACKRKSLHNFSSFVIVPDSVNRSLSSPSASQGLFVLYALRSDGGVYAMDVSISSDKVVSSAVRGPLNAEIPFASDLTQSATSIAYIEAALPVLAFSTNSQKIYFGILLDKSNDEMEIEGLSSNEMDLSDQELVFIERLEMPVQGYPGRRRSLTRLLTNRETPSCIALESSQQLIAVALPWIDDLPLLAEGTLDLDSIRSSTVQCVTTIDPNDQEHSAILLGSQLLKVGASIHLLSVASNGEVVDQIAMTHLPEPTSSVSGKVTHRDQPESEAIPFSERLLGMLKRESTLPSVMFASPESATAEDLMALVRQATKVFEEQYLNKQRQAFAEISSRRKRLESRKKHLDEVVGSFEQKLREAEREYFQFLNDSEMVELDGARLQDRVSAVQEELGRYNPVMTDAEKQLDENLNHLDAVVDELDDKLQSVQEKFAYRMKGSGGAYAGSGQGLPDNHVVAELCRVENLKKKLDRLKGQLNVSD